MNTSKKSEIHTQVEEAEGADYLAAILVRLAPRRIATARRMDKGELRVLARGPNFESLLADAFDQIRQNAPGNVAVLTRLLQSLEIIARPTEQSGRKEALRKQADLIAELAERTIASPHDRVGVEVAWVRLSKVLTPEKGATE